MLEDGFSPCEIQNFERINWFNTHHNPHGRILSNQWTFHYYERVKRTPRQKLSFINLQVRTVMVDEPKLGTFERYMIQCEYTGGHLDHTYFENLLIAWKWRKCLECCFLYAVLHVKLFTFHRQAWNNEIIVMETI